MTGRLRVAAWMLVGLATGALLAALLAVPVVVSQIRSTQVDNTEKADQRDETLVAVKHLARKINSCVTPGKPCHDRGQKQTSNAVAQLLTGNVNALACAMQVPPDTPVEQTIELITACLRELPSAP